MPARFLIRDNDAKFSGAFDEVFRAEVTEVIRIPVEAPKANAIVERCVGTVRRECPDWILIASRRHLERVLRTFVDHYKGHRPHRAWTSRRRRTRVPCPCLRASRTSKG